MSLILPHIISLTLISIGFSSRGQALLMDTIKARQNREEYLLIILPANYEKISNKLSLSEIKRTDSFSLRLWTSHMYGNNLITFDKQGSQWESHYYHYQSDTTFEELKISPKISTAEFVSKLQTFNFDNFISQYQIKDFSDHVDDGAAYTLEIITKGSYKVFQYHSPGSFKDPDNRNFQAVIQLLEKYFHTRY